MPPNKLNTGKVQNSPGKKVTKKETVRAIKIEGDFANLKNEEIQEFAVLWNAMVHKSDVDFKVTSQGKPSELEDLLKNVFKNKAAKVIDIALTKVKDILTQEEFLQQSQQSIEPQKCELPLMRQQQEGRLQKNQQQKEGTVTNIIQNKELDDKISQLTKEKTKLETCINHLTEKILQTVKGASGKSMIQHEQAIEQLMDKHEQAIELLLQVEVSKSTNNRSDSTAKINGEENKLTDGLHKKLNDKSGAIDNLVRDLEGKLKDTTEICERLEMSKELDEDIQKVVGVVNKLIDKCNSNWAKSAKKSTKEGSSESAPSVNGSREMSYQISQLTKEKEELEVCINTLTGKILKTVKGTHGATTQKPMEKHEMAIEMLLTESQKLPVKENNIVSTANINGEKDKLTDDSHKKLREKSVAIDNLIRDLEDKLKDTTGNYDKLKLSQDEQIQKVVSVVNMILDKNKSNWESQNSAKSGKKSKKEESPESAPAVNGNEVNNAIKLLENEVRDLTARLSQEMNAKIGANESSLENISIKNRPMNIKEDYELICASSWLDAKTEIDTVKEIKEKERFLCKILETSSNCANIMYGHAVNYVLKALEDSTKMNKKPDDGNKTTKQRKGNEKLQDQIQMELGDIFRKMSDNVDLTCLINDIKQKLEPDLKKVSMKKALHKYIDDCGHLGWKMAIQRPSMEFRTPGVGDKWAGEKSQEISWGSGDPTKEGAAVKFYVHPQLYHGKSMMVKGKVYIGNK